MANDALAPVAASPPGAPSEDEYQTFCAALSASGRGRAFLAEYTRRNRGADTEVLLAALARLESVMRLQRERAEPLRAELRTLHAVIRAARPEIEAGTLPTRAAKLAQLLDILECRIATLAEEARVLPAGEAQLAVVPPAEEPELPIPSPTAAPPALTIAHDRTPSPAVQPVPEIAVLVIVPEVTWLDGPPPGAIELDETFVAEAAAPPRTAEKVAALTTQPLQEAVPAEKQKVLESLFAEMPPPRDPLRPLMLLSEHERLALFT